MVSQFTRNTRMTMPIVPVEQCTTVEVEEGDGEGNSEGHVPPYNPEMHAF